MTPLLPRALRRVTLALSLTGALALTACFEPAAPAGPTTEADASRFLHMATFGTTQAEMDHLLAVGYEGWLNEQFDKPAADNYTEYVNRGGPPGCEICSASGMGAVQEAFWYQAVEGPDQLRHRVAFALSELFVISAAANTTLADYALALPGFHTMLADNAFGNFRTILEKVTLNPAMGVFLSHRQNDKEDPSTGRLPDENYAREVMQLFTIGKWLLNQDGTPMRDAQGEMIPAYNQSHIMGMARALTGWSWGGGDTSEARWNGWSVNGEDPMQWDTPMQPYPTHHSGSEKTLVGGTVIPAGTTPQESLRIALDTLFNHPNTGPFVATHLIKRLVTSNPSPEYVSRVAAVFASNAQGERGNMRSVVRAVLFDPEAHSADRIASPGWGKLREPTLRIANYLRAFNARNSRHAYVLSGMQTIPYDMGQTPWMAQTVFNFFTPDHTPGGVMADNQLTGPEFQILDESTSVGYVNYMQRGVENNFGTAGNAVTPDYTRELALAGDPAALLTRVATLLNGNRISAETRTLMENTVRSIPEGATDWKLRRVKMAIILVMASPDYLIQK